MTGGNRSDLPPAEAVGEDLHDRARDWITPWQSEVAALAVDREAQETWYVLLSLWVAQPVPCSAACRGGWRVTSWPLSPARRGLRPPLLHLMLAMLKSSASVSAPKSLNGACAALNPRRRAGAAVQNACHDASSS